MEAVDRQHREVLLNSRLCFPPTYLSCCPHFGLSILSLSLSFFCWVQTLSFWQRMGGQWKCLAIQHGDWSHCYFQYLPYCLPCCNHFKKKPIRPEHRPAGTWTVFSWLLCWLDGQICSFKRLCKELFDFLIKLGIDIGLWLLNILSFVHTNTVQCICLWGINKVLNIYINFTFCNINLQNKDYCSWPDSVCPQVCLW